MGPLEKRPTTLALERMSWWDVQKWGVLKLLKLEQAQTLLKNAFQEAQGPYISIIKDILT